MTANSAPLSSECSLPTSNLVLMNQLQFYSKDIGPNVTCKYAMDTDKPGLVDLQNANVVAIEATEIPANVTVLNLAENQLTEFPTLKAMGLKELNLSSNPIQSVQNLAIPDTVTTLKLNHIGISSLEGMTWPTNLTALNLAGNQLTSFPKVEGLHSLNLNDNPIQSFENLDLPSSLLELILINTSIVSANDIQLPPGLTYLDLSLNQLKVFPKLDAPSLVQLYLEYNPIPSLPAERIPRSLGLLNMTGTLLSNIDNVTLPPKLINIMLSSTNISSMRNVRAPSLKSIDFLGMLHPIKLANFEFPNEDMEIYLSDNYNIDFEGARFPDGSAITLHSCQLQSIDGIPFPRYMPFVVLNNNSIQAFPQFPADQGRIETIYLESNQMTTFANISLPPSLTSLYLNGNNITEIRGVDFPCSLQELEIADSPLTNLEISQTKYDEWSTSGKVTVTLNPGVTMRCQNGAIQRTVAGRFSVCVLPDDTWNELYPQTFMWIKSEDTKGSSSFSQAVETKSGTSGVMTGAIVASVVGLLVILAFVAALFVWKRRRSPADASNSTGEFSFVVDESGNGSSISAIMSDPAVYAAKIPLNLIEIGASIGKGGYGEVYKGTYKGESVAIKKLFAEHRKSAKHIERLLTEAKLMSSMDHPNIARFIGIAWDALTDLCIVVEYMGGGDLRGLLVQFKNIGKPRGLDAEKLRIAKDIANGLTYLHSLDPKVLHRDLKSGNVLLSEQLEAKLTDFGISREASEATMTAGIGTSLWMAPEVMTGGHYDEKADIFSLGVVLSELDTHEYPYAQHKLDASGRVIPETALLQRVAQGTIRATISDDNDAQVLAIAHRCLSLYPDERPSAPEVAYVLMSAHQRLSRSYYY